MKKINTKKLDQKCENLSKYLQNLTKDMTVEEYDYFETKFITIYLGLGAGMRKIFKEDAIDLFSPTEELMERNTTTIRQI